MFHALALFIALAELAFVFLAEKTATPWTRLSGTALHAASLVPTHPVLPFGHGRLVWQAVLLMALLGELSLGGALSPFPTLFAALPLLLFAATQAVSRLLEVRAAIILAAFKKWRPVVRMPEARSPSCPRSKSAASSAASRPSRSESTPWKAALRGP